MIFFTSDHHFGHTNIIRYCARPFQTAEDMDEEMIKRWNAVVKPDDTVYYLGDFSLGARQVENIAPRLNGEKHLIMGNHDPCHPIHKKKAEAGRQIYLAAGFKTLELEKNMEIGGQAVLLNHMPYLSENPVEPVSAKEGIPKYDLKYKEFRPLNKGLPLLHGHIHEKWKTNARMINVGVDVWDFYPVPISEIEKLLALTR